MSDLAEWLRDLLAHVTRETDVMRLLDDLAQVTALQHEALSELSLCSDPECEQEAMNLRDDALAAAEALKEKYG